MQPSPQIIPFFSQQSFPEANYSHDFYLYADDSNLYF